FLQAQPHDVGIDDRRLVQHISVGGQCRGGRQRQRGGNQKKAENPNVHSSISKLLSTSVRMTLLRYSPRNMNWRGMYTRAPRPACTVGSVRSRGCTKRASGSILSRPAPMVKWGDTRHCGQGWWVRLRLSSWLSEKLPRASLRVSSADRFWV